MKVLGAKLSDPEGKVMPLEGTTKLNTNIKHKKSSIMDSIITHNMTVKFWTLSELMSLFVT